MEKQRIMIINWRWIQHNVAKFPKKDTALFQNGMKLGTWKKVFEKEWREFMSQWGSDILNQADKVKNELEEVVNAWVLRLEINLSEGVEKEKRQFALDHMLKQFHEKLLQRGRQSSSELLVFFHKKHGFQPEEVPPPTKTYKDLRYFPFGGGTDAIYDKNGLLGEGDYFMGLGKKTHAAVYHPDTEEVQFVKLKHFDYVWDHYRSGVSRRIRAIRKLYHTALIPGVELDAVLRKVLKHLLTTLEGKEDHLTKEEPSEEEQHLVQYDFGKVPNFWESKYRHQHYPFLLERDLIDEIQKVLQSGGNCYSPTLVSLLDRQIALLDT